MNEREAAEFKLLMEEHVFKRIRSEEMTDEEIQEAILAYLMKRRDEGSA